MFEKIRVQYFKSIIDSEDIDLSNLNIFVGTNNAGKSSLFDSLLLLKQTIEDKDPSNVLVTSGNNVDLGSYLDIIWGQNLKNNLCLSFKLKSNLLPNFRFGSSSPITSSKFFSEYKIIFGFSRTEHDIFVKGFTIKNEDGITIEAISKGNKWHYYNYLEELKDKFKIKFYHFTPAFEPIITSTTTTGNDDLSKKLYNLYFLSSYQSTSLQQIFSDLRYVAPVREEIPRYSILGSTKYSEITPSGRNLMRVLSKPIKIGKRKKKDIQRELNLWLGDRFKILKNIRIVPLDKKGTIKSLLADDPNGKKNINLSQMGNGISQLVPVIVHTVMTPENGCILLKQPELHLHPAAQADIADLFIHYSNNNRQIFVETHSEHLLLRIRRRIAEGKISPKNVSIFIANKSKEGGTKFKKLDLDSDGGFQQWPENFFEEGYQESSAIVNANIKKVH